MSNVHERVSVCLRVRVSVRVCAACVRRACAGEVIELSACTCARFLFEFGFVLFNRSATCVYICAAVSHITIVYSRKDMHTAFCW